MINIVYHIKHNELKHLISCRKKDTVSTGEGKWFLVLRKSSYLINTYVLNLNQDIRLLLKFLIII